MTEKKEKYPPRRPRANFAKDGYNATPTSKIAKQAERVEPDIPAFRK